MLNANDNKNIVWVDIAKFIAMFLVVFEHVVLAFKLNDAGFTASVRNVIVTFHMPLFFLISGFLYKQKSRAENYEKILWALIVPYFIYQFIYLPFKLGYYTFFEHIPFNIAAIKCFIGILLGDNLGTEGSKYALSVYPALWFVMVMIQLRFIFAHVNMTIKNLSLISIIAFVLLKLLNVYNIDLYFCLDNTLYAIPYFAAGYFMKNYVKSERQLTNGANIYMCFFLLCLLYGVCTFKQYCPDLLLLKYACGFLGSFAVINFSKIFENTNNFVDVIAKNTLFIIFFHSLLLFITKWMKLYIVTQFIHENYQLFIFVVFYAMLLYVINYSVIILMQKYKVNILLGKYKPGRQAW